jgi:hypothetical protein
MTTVEDSISVGSLTYDERHEFEMCVETIDRGFKVWYEVGKALLKIRDKRLYREEHQTFEACVQERWGLKRQRAYELMGASQVVENLSEISDTPPRYESHVAPLSILAPDEQRAVWSLVEQTAPGGKGNVTVGMFQADESLVIMTCDTPPGIETGKRYKVTIEAIEE